MIWFGFILTEMETIIPAIASENLFSLLSGALFSAQLFVVGGGYLPVDIFLFAIVAFIVTLIPVSHFKTADLKSYRVRSTYLYLRSRKSLIHRNDPLLI